MNQTKLPYEFHVTVDAQNINPHQFLDDCVQLETKGIVLDLGINNGTVLTDVMTSSTRMYSSDEEAFGELRRLSDGLQTKGYDVTRRKIESAPWHPFAPQQPNDVMPEGSYFESHMAILCPPDNIPTLREGIVARSKTVPLHLSRNAFKKAENGNVVVMSTLRNYEDCYQRFASKVLLARSIISDLGFELNKEPIVEFALYDSNTHQDDAWMKR